MKKKIALTVFITASLLIPYFAVAGSRLQEPRTIKLVADKDNKFKIPGRKKPILVAYPGEQLKLIVEAHKAQEWEEGGYVHGLVIKGYEKLGWNVKLKEGVKEIIVTAPPKPGKYLIECSVKCGHGHDYMRALLVVVKPKRVS